jgi:hypothetical protein
MRLDRLSKRVLGIATIGNPIAAVGLIAGLALYPFVLPGGESMGYPKDQLLYFALGVLVMVIVGAITIASLAVTTIFYAFHIVRNEGLSKRKKIIWSLLNVTFGIFAMPLYWYRHVSPRRGN